MWAKIRNERAIKTKACCEAINSITINAEKEQLKFCIIKGLSFANNIYSNPSYRAMRDIDILVNEVDMHKMDKLLKDLFESSGISGYENEVAQISTIVKEQLGTELKNIVIIPAE